MTLVSLWTLVTSKRKSRKLTKHWSYYEKPLKTHVVSNVLFKLRALKMIEEELKSLPSREPVNTELQGGIMSLVKTLFNLWRIENTTRPEKKRKGSNQMKWYGTRWWWFMGCVFLLSTLPVPCFWWFGSQNLHHLQDSTISLLSN